MLSLDLMLLIACGPHSFCASGFAESNVHFPFLASTAGSTFRKGIRTFLLTEGKELRSWLNTPRCNLFGLRGSSGPAVSSGLTLAGNFAANLMPLVLWLT